MTLAGLSPRRRQIVELLGQGKGSKEIAVELGISPQTVEKVIHGLYTQTGTHSRLELTHHFFTLVPRT